jgi:hypothetical protein
VHSASLLRLTARTGRHPHMLLLTTEMTQSTHGSCGTLGLCLHAATPTHTCTEACLAPKRLAKGRAGAAATCTSSSSSSSSTCWGAALAPNRPKGTGEAACVLR